MKGACGLLRVQKQEEWNSFWTKQIKCAVGTFI